MGAVSTSVSTFQGITAALATMALCWLTMATTAWVRSVLVGRGSGGGCTPVAASTGNTWQSLGLSQSGEGMLLVSLRIFRY